MTNSNTVFRLHGNTASFPGLGLANTGIEIVLADNSDYTFLRAKKYYAVNEIIISDKITIKPHSNSEVWTFKFPKDNGNVATFLANDGNGNTYWTSINQLILDTANSTIVNTSDTAANNVKTSLLGLIYYTNCS